MSEIKLVLPKAPSNGLGAIQKLPVGTAVVGKVNGHRSIYLRTYDGLVDLSDPQRTWGSLNWEFEDAEARIVKLTIIAEHL